ncbi:MAG: TVP38/TMEM64 family protein [Proteobacteria bacterium]|nr:TVP38/TMEM64 family protein [Pseudomonadota bacterium]
MADASWTEAGAAISVIAMLVGVLICGIAAWRWLAGDLAELLSLTPEAVERFANYWTPWPALGSVILMVIHSFLPLPAEVIAIANGMMFGVFWGSATTWVGAMLGAILSFGTARWVGRPVFRRFVAPRYRREIERWHGNTLALLVVRFIPVFSFNVINYAAGVSGVGWWTFLWTTAVGIVPITVVSVAFGHSLLMASWSIWTLAVAAIAVVVTATWHVRRRSRKVAASALRDHPILDIQTAGDAEESAGQPTIEESRQSAGQR